MTFYEVWRFETRHFVVKLEIEGQEGYQYDGDDEDGETQRKLDDGEYVAFDSSVIVYLKSPLARVDPVPIGADHLGGSVYEAGSNDFWTDHWKLPAHARNCTHYRELFGQNAVVCHYFPGMVKEAVRNARQTMAGMPTLRPFLSGDEHAPTSST